MANFLDAGLNSFARKVCSQYGEDGIIEEALRRIGGAIALDKWCVEFGAWDGIYLSNTYRLIRDAGYRAVLIEGDPKKHRELCSNIPQDDVHKICVFVTFTGANTLDRILAGTPIPKEFDFLSIDIDGCDYFIFESLVDYRPKLICIEHNPTIPNEVAFVQEKNFGIKQGASAKALTVLASRKGYSPVATTSCNVILVRDDLMSAVIGAQRLTLEDLRDDSDSRTFVFSGYDGTILSNKAQVVAKWHGIGKPISEMQVLPKMLRTFPSDYGALERWLYKGWTFLLRIRSKL